MTPGQASKQGKTLLINHPLGGRRVAAHVFDLPGGGIAFMDSGWTDPYLSSHPGHQCNSSFQEVDPGIWHSTGQDGEIYVEIYPNDAPPEGAREFARTEIERLNGVVIPKE